MSDDKEQHSCQTRTGCACSIWPRWSIWRTSEPRMHFLLEVSKGTFCVLVSPSISLPPDQNCRAQSKRGRQRGSNPGRGLRRPTLCPVSYWGRRTHLETLDDEEADHLVGALLHHGGSQTLVRAPQTCNIAHKHVTSGRCVCACVLCVCVCVRGMTLRTSCA